MNAPRCFGSRQQSFAKNGLNSGVVSKGDFCGHQVCNLMKLSAGVAAFEILSGPTCVAKVGDICGEGAVWHAPEAALYWTDINRFLIHRYDPRSHDVETWEFSEPVTAVNMTTRDDTLAVVLGSRVILWEPRTGRESPPPSDCVIGHAFG